MDKVDRHLQELQQTIAAKLRTFEQAVAIEQAELRSRMIQQLSELAKLRARIGLLESEVEHRLLESKSVSAVTLCCGEDVNAGEPLAGDSTAGGEVQLAALRTPRRSRFGRCRPHTSRRRL